MKHLLNTLYVTTQGAYLGREGETIEVRHEERTLIQVPVHTLASVVAFGRVGCSPQLMALCAENGVSLAFMTENGRFLARVQGRVSGNVLLRRAQYRIADDESMTGRVARTMVTAKIANGRRVLLRAMRETDESERAARLDEAASRLEALIRLVRATDRTDSLRGLEGEAGSLYFGVFDDLILVNKDVFYMRARTRRPPMDPLNSLLSFVYTLLAHDSASALEGVGLDPAVGFLHKDRPGRASLALDLMEELRPFFADRLVLTLVNRQQVQAGSFRRAESGAYLMTDEARKQVIVAYQKRKQEELEHPFLKERIPYGLLPHVQALLLARFVRGELDDYPAMLWR